MIADLGEPPHDPTQKVVNLDTFCAAHAYAHSRKSLKRLLSALPYKHWELIAGRTAMRAAESSESPATIIQRLIIKTTARRKRHCRTKPRELGYGLKRYPFENTFWVIEGLTKRAYLHGVQKP